MRTLQLGTALDAPADTVWRAVKDPRTFAYVAGRLARFPAAERVDGTWEEGTQIRGWLLLFGVVPISLHSIRIASIDEQQRVMTSQERGGPLRTWQHTLTTTPIDEQRCYYEDRVVFEAGALTGVVFAGAELFFRYRQRRWRALARELAAGRQPAAVQASTSRAAT